jgi:hypothetical protein
METEIGNWIAIGGTEAAPLGTRETQEQVGIEIVSEAEEILGTQEIHGVVEEDVMIEMADGIGREMMIGTEQEMKEGIVEIEVSTMRIGCFGISE